ncbi:holin family protein [Andreesenia angusta]|uniref:Holin family protein n=1 Tax=Andreesenia angusta TaxID=39480 RepID=A0A1S1V5I7_9FIRM|nr:phage holin family protein [Andreesenia angusta]OHW61367.1 holin family protein [Andreesenia angusta]
MERVNLIKTGLLSTAGVVGSTIAHALGGWDGAIITLTSFMVADVVTGYVLAFFFENSPKTENGGASSAEGFKGICKKVMMLVMVYMAVRIDMLVGTDYIRDGVVIAFIVNEILSIAENAGQMGLDFPPVLVKGIEILKSKNEEE